MSISNFRLAVDRGRKDKDGKSETDWLNVVCFEKTSENVAAYCDKGMLVGIEGRIQSRSWEDKEGKRQYSVEIVASNVRFLESRAEAERRRGSSGGGEQQEQRQSRPAAAPAPAPAAPVDDDDFDPFGSD